MSVNLGPGFQMHQTHELVHENYDSRLRPQTYNVREWVHCYRARQQVVRSNGVATLFGRHDHRASQCHDTAL